MTTMAMIFGMLPIAIGMGEGGGFRAPMARAVIGGLITSTLLTLVVVPVAYTYFDDFGGWVARGFKRKPREEKAPAPAPKPSLGGLAPEPGYGD
jgi:hydrophobic/amphiphilic exporter-1 (mainly G- bacteria), HAE1 family